MQVIMKKKISKIKPAKTLRQRAQEVQRKTRGPLSGEPSRETGELARDLGAHRIELDMQNNELRASHAAIEASRQKYADLFDFAPVGYFVLDEKGAVTDVNITGSALLGKEKSRIIGRSFSRYVFADDQDAWHLYRRKMMAPGGVQETEIRLIKKENDAMPVYTLIKGIAVREEASGNVQYRIAMTDATGRKMAEEALKKANDELEIRVEQRTAELKSAMATAKKERQRLYDVLETLPVYVILLSKDYRVPFANRFFRERFGESGGKRCFEYLFNRTGQCENCESFKALATKAPHHWEWTGPDDCNYDIYDFPFTDADGSSLIMEMGIDSTETKKALAALERSNETLEVRVAERTKDLAESEARFKAIAETSPLGIGVVSAPDGKFLYVNAAYEKKYGYSKGELLGKTTPDIYWDAGDRSRILSMLKERGVVVDYEARFRRKDGTLFWGLASVKPIIYGNAQALLGVFVDISDRKYAEERLHKLNHVLAALGKSSQAMIRAENESDYLKEVCGIVVEECGYKMAWIGFALDDGKKTVKPVAYSGFEEEYLEKADITWADDERGKGPTGTAIRTGKTAICRNMLVDPDFAPWREEAMRRGYASSIVLPLMERSKAFGAISIYSKDPDPFSEEEIVLLTDLSTDVAHAIMTLRIRAAKAVAEENLHNERNFINAIVQTTGGLIVGLDMEGRIQLFNRACEKTTGYKFSEVKGRVIWEFLLIPEEREPVKEVFGEIKSGAHSAEVEFENYWVTRTGERRFIKWTNSALKDENDDVQLIIGTGIDITERKKVEEEILRASDDLRRSNEELERFNRAMIDRELRMIKLKKQVNELCVRLGEPRKYEMGFEEDDDTRTVEK
jgi:PAS domain S-box-containing protein